MTEQDKSRAFELLEDMATLREALRPFAGDQSVLGDAFKIADAAIAKATGADQ